jgi:multiple sugar transport system substrate-binding protein
MMGAGVSAGASTARRRTFLGAGAAGLAGAALAACAAGGPGSTPGSATTAPSKGPVTIDVLTRPGVASPTGHSQWYQNTTTKKFTPETGITVNLIDAQPDVTAKLQVLAAAGTPPDGSWLAVVADGSGGREQASKGIFKPLDDLVNRDKFDKAPYFKAMLDVLSVNGKLYALPTMSHYGTNILYYNKQLTDGAGVTVPQDGSWSVDDFIVAAQKVTKKGEDIWGWWPDFSDVSEYGVFWVRQFGGEFLDEAGKKVLLDTPEARAGLEWVYNAQAKFQTIDNLYRTDSKDTLFEQQGRLGFRSATPGLVAEYKKAGQARLGPTFQLGIALFPRGPKGHGTQASGSGMGITGDKNKDATWKWVQFITSKDNGVDQVQGGAGSPGGRTDVWTDPRLLAFDPIYSTIVKAYPQGTGSLRQPANFQRTDLLKAVNDELAAYWKGEASLADATSKAVQAGNTVLSQ